MTDLAVVMRECVGLWRRTLLIEADGSRDTGTDVLWLQGVSAYVDSRGFAGVLTQHGDVFAWRRDIDALPPAEFPDEGHMSWDGDVLVERGVHSDYVEHWVRDTGPAEPCWAVELGAGADRALLMRVGDRFGWARGESAVLGRVGDGRWEAVGPVGEDAGIRADGVHWNVMRSEGEVEL